jgi:hypothetical protein
MFGNMSENRYRLETGKLSTCKNYIMRSLTVSLKPNITDKKRKAIEITETRNTHWEFRCA